MMKLKNILIIVFLVLVIFIFGCRRPVCGNGIIEEGETMQTCCEDTGCLGEQTCEFHRCIDPICSECQYLQNHVCIDYKCCKDDDCNKDEICQSHQCVKLNCGECQYIENHKCENYQCCSDADCENFYAFKESRCINPATVDSYCKIVSSVAIFVDRNTYSSLNYEINRLKEDIIYDLDTEVYIYSEDWSDPEEIRKIILDKYYNNGLLGSILIGNIPYVLYRSAIKPSQLILSDFYYTDMDEKIDKCYKEGIVERLCMAESHIRLWPMTETWVGRIKPTKGDQEGIEQIRNYINRNHNYRKGLIKYDNKANFIYADFSIEPNYTLERIYPQFERMVNNSRLYKGNAKIIFEKNSSKLKNKVINTFKDQNELTFLAVHGSPRSDWFGESEYLYSEDIENLKPNSMIYDLASCSNGAFNVEDYMAGAYLFSGNALVVFAYSVIAVVAYNEDIYTHIGQLRLGVPIGKVYRNRQSSLVQHLFGDPTLKLRAVRLEDAPKLKVDGFVVDFGENPIGNKKEIDYVIKNEGNSKLIINTVRPGSLVTKLNGNMSFGWAHTPFYCKFGSNSDLRSNKIEIEPHSKTIVKLFFDLESVKEVKKGVYEGYFYQIVTNDPRQPWITIKLIGRGI
ncbi:hypothetical protein KY342_01890 [Candidatus Woesearchaeota archaeon]|nr:hypothetical protein [Candidatus Woesearchaeota archaeon]